MNTFEYTGYVPNLTSLVSDLQGMGYNVLSASQHAGASPVTYVHVDDAETRETEIGTEVTNQQTSGIAIMGLASDGVVDFDGVLKKAADGVAIHTITVQKEDENGTPITTGTESIEVLTQSVIAVSSRSFVLVAGTKTFTVGPESTPCDVVLHVVDSGGIIEGRSIRIRFR